MIVRALSDHLTTTATSLAQNRRVSKLFVIHTLIFVLSCYGGIQRSLILVLEAQLR